MAGSMDILSRKRWLARAVAEVRRDAHFWYRPHVRQRDFHAAGAVACERLFLAGNRVGKTLAGAVEVGFHMTGRYPRWWTGARFDAPVRAWAASVTREMTRDILQSVYLGAEGQRGGGAEGVIPRRLVLGMTMKGGIAGAVDTVKVRHVSGGTSVLSFKSYDQGRAAFQGTAREVIHLDEEPEIGVYEECLLRTLGAEGRKGGMILLTMTPLKGLTEMVRHFTESGRLEGKVVVQAGWREAPHLDSEEVARLRKSLRGFEVRAREFGEPCVGKGRVFPIAEEEITCARFEIPAAWKRCVGVDFGWSNPTAAVWLAYDSAHDIVYVTDVYCASERVPAEHAAEILRRGNWIPAVCDPSGQAVGVKDGASLMEVYEKHGLRFDAADNAVEAGLMAWLERMRAGKFRVFEDLLPWWHEFRIYARDERGRVIKRDDHLMDATRYALVSGLVLARGEGEVRTVTRRPMSRGEVWVV